MTVKRTKIDVALEKQILTGCIVSSEFLREFIQIYASDLMEIEYAPIVIRWCMTYYEKYSKAPGRVIQDLFEKWEDEAPSNQNDKIRYIEAFLKTLSDEYEHGDKFNAPYCLDKTLTYFKKRSLKLLSEDLDFYLNKNDLIEAEKALGEYRKVEKITARGIDIYDDMNAIQTAFDSVYEPLFVVPGALGRLMNPELTRDAFVVLLAPEKRGKSWWMQFLGMCAHRGRCNVAEFQVGDMSEPQRTRRQHISLARKSDKMKYCGEILIPVLDCEKNQKDLCDSKNRAAPYGVYEDGEKMSFEDAEDHTPCTYCSNKPGFRGAIWHYRRKPVTPLTWREAYKCSQEYKKRVRPKGYKLSTHSAGSINVDGIRNILELWERTEGFVADVVIIDYIQLLDSQPGSSSEARHSLNQTNIALRKLSQDLHCCLISAVQADAASYYLPRLTKSNFSEDKRIFGHVTAMFALNQTVDEKRAGIMRIAPLVIREEDYDEGYDVHVGGCLAIGSPYLFSY